MVIHFFTNGKVSTRPWMDKDDRWGRSWAYEQDGGVIMEHQTRRLAGRASIDFSYHLNGAISKAECSEAPDAGIHWYRSTTTYDDKGNQTGFSEQGHHNFNIIPGPGVRVTQKPEVTSPYKQEVVVEQRMFVSDVFVVISSKYTGWIWWRCIHRPLCITATTPWRPAIPSGWGCTAPARSTRKPGST